MIILIRVSSSIKQNGYYRDGMVKITKFLKMQRDENIVI